MRTVLAALTIACTALVGLNAGAAAAHRAAAVPRHPALGCAITAYTKNCGGCATLSAAGAFTLAVPHTHLRLHGKSGAADSGTKVCAAKVAAPRPSMGGVGIRITATGPFKPFKIPKAKIYQYNPKSGSLTKVKAIKKPGVYQVIGG
jgi:hypothetical protein